MVRDFANDLSALALNTATLGHMLDGKGAGWSPERVVDACAERGFGGVVFWRRELGGRARDIGERCRAAGMRVGGLCRTPFITGPGAAEEYLDDSKAAIDTAAELGAEVLTIVSGGVEPGSKGVLESQRILAERLAGLVDYAAGSDVRLALEPLNPMFGGNRTCVMTVPDALRVCDAVGADAVLGIAVDVYHVWWDGGLKAHISAAQGRIFGFHLCDWLAETRDMLLDRGMMGDGVADVRGIRRTVEAAGYAGLCEVEVFSERDWWRRDPGEVLDVIVERFRSVC